MESRNPNLLENAEQAELEQFLSSHQAKSVFHPWLGLLAKSQLAGVNKKFNALFQPKVTDAKLAKLADDVMKGNKDAVKRKLDTSPYLLLEKCAERIKGYAEGRTFNNISPWGIAVLEGDVDMLIMMDDYLDNVYNGREIAQEQFNAQRSKIKENNNNRYDFTSLMSAILNDPFIDDKANITTEIELLKFRKEVAQKNKDCFDTQLFLDALSICNKYIGSSYGELCTVTCNQVLGYIQRFFPACDAQALCNKDFDKLLAHKKPLDRHFQTYTGRIYYPLDMNASHILGRDYYVFPTNAFPSCRREWLDAMKSYFCQKELALEYLSITCKASKPSQIISYF